MAVDLVEGEPAIYMVAGRLQIALVQTRRPQRMARLHLVIGVSVRLSLRQECVAHRARRIEFGAHVVDAPKVPASAKPALAVAEFLGKLTRALVRSLSFGRRRAERIGESDAEAPE